jgi:hypothetical protein
MANAFTEPDDSSEEWADVRMSDPEEGEWDIDAVVMDGRVEYVDLRIRPELLGSFVECLLADVGERRAAALLSELTDEDA